MRGIAPRVVERLYQQCVRKLGDIQTGGERLSASAYDHHCADAGLVAVDRWATWDREPFAGGDYVVSVHRKP